MRLAKIWIPIALAVSSSAALAEVVTLAVPASASTVAGGIALDADDNVYSADFGGTTVFRILTDGSLETFAQGFQTPSGNAFDAEGYLLQSNYADQSNQGAPDSISRVSPDGEVEEYVAGLNGPVGIAVADDGSLFVAMCNAQAVWGVSPDRATSTFASSSLFACPNGIVFDEYGDLYVVNYNDGSVIRVEPDGQVSLFASIPTTGLGHVTWVSGSLYVADRNGHLVWEVGIKPNGKARPPRVLAGTGTAGRVDGPNDQAQFNLPNAMARNAIGDTIYTNGFGGAVRAISLELPRPRKPKKAKGKIVDEDTVRLSWKDRHRNREGWFVEMRIKGETGWEPIADVPAGQDEVEITEPFEPGKRYEFRLLAYNGSEISKPSKKIRVRF